MDCGQARDVKTRRDPRRASVATRASHATQTTHTNDPSHQGATQNGLNMADGKARGRVPSAVNLVIRSDSPRVVETAPENFREVVQRLTGLRKTRHLQPRSGRPPKHRLRRTSSIGSDVRAKMEMEMDRAALATASLASLPAAPLLKMEDDEEERIGIVTDHHHHRGVRIDFPCGFAADGKQLVPPTLRTPDSVLDAAAAVWSMPQDFEFCTTNGGLDLGCSSRLGAAPFGLLPPADPLQDSICAASAAAMQEPFFIDQTVTPSLYDSGFPACPINDYSFSAMGFSSLGAGLAIGVPDHEGDLQAALRKPAMEFGQLATAAACKETAVAVPSNSWFRVDGNLDGVQEEVGFMPMLDPQPPSIFQRQTTCPWDGF